MPRNRLHQACFAFLLCSPGVALAEGPSPDSSSTAAFESQLGWTQGSHSGGFTAGGLARISYRLLTAGASVQAATVLLSSMGSASTVAGVTLPFGVLRLDALGECGLNAYAGVGGNFLSHDPGAKAIRPFLGGRLSVFGRIVTTRRVDVWLGVSGTYAADTYTETEHYTYRDQSTNWFTGDYRDEIVAATADVGQSRFAILATTGVTLPL